MLRWAFGYLAMAVVVGIGFAVLQGTEPPERGAEARAARPNAASVRGTSAAARQPASDHELADESFADDAGGSDDGDDSDYEEYPQDDDGLEDEGDVDAGDLEYVIEPGAGGHYVVEAVVNGAPITFLVDTGASSIVLTMDDAARLGFRPETLRFTQRFVTANGEVRGAPVTLRELRIGQFSLYDVPASVNEAPLSVSLLGMSFLRRLDGYAVEDGRLVLRW
jgi:clan AA aspartic protease (TIGR02281 family)